MRTKFQFLALLLPLLVAALPASVSAQWRYPPIYYPPYGGYRYPEPESSLRLNVKPKEASVYVDGYFAGKVEEFDGRLQRLHTLPGEHEIVVYLDGYRSLRQRLYLSPNATRTIDGTLEKLAAGEAMEPQPQPRPGDGDRDDQPGPPDRGRTGPPRTPTTRRPPPQDQPPPRRDPRGTDAPQSRFASLSIRVQPGGGVVLVDGERWDGPSGDERLIIQVPEGHHVIEVDRDGYEHFTTEIDVRRGETAPLNISLRRR